MDKISDNEYKYKYLLVASDKKINKSNCPIKIIQFNNILFVFILNLNDYVIIKIDRLLYTYVKGCIVQYNVSTPTCIAYK